MKTLQVFEYQSIKVGNELTENQFEALANFAEKHQSKYFSITHKGIKFSHYVGALQVDDLTIEILPKADRDHKPNKKKWQSVLLEMLRACRLLKIESLTDAHLKLRPNLILELYFEIFVSEVEKLLSQGLIKSYRRNEANLKVLKGRLVVPKQLRKNQLHKEKFYTNHEEYDYNHLLNHIISKGLDILAQMVFEPNLDFRIQKLKSHFPKVDNIEITETNFQKIYFHRQTIRYQTALDIARMLILNYSPDIQGGKKSLIAILFDMNLLFEEYVFRQLKKCQSEDLMVKRQTQKPFWNRRYLRPDILLNWKGETIVLDTKWKVLKKINPNMEDLRQAFVYNRFFEAEKCVLVYPKVYDLEDLGVIPFEEVNEKSACQVCFLDVLINEKLGSNIGQNLLKKIIEI
ncbi:McrC family protein [Saprospiraceae bacterium]|jgi:5-methylcytosine-specific restriction enzyme subunit McrC|nr:McrC family protein [Bacteroidota bacterium]MDB4727589.1 McrC family protein [Saprospiraceae bacterium]